MDPAVVLRASPAYEVVLLDRLPRAQRDAVIARHDEDSGALYGVLQPRTGTSAQLRTLSHDTALLLLTLREPGPLPEYARAALEGRTDAVVSGLVLDGVLEIAANGAFVSGAAARALLLPAITSPTAGLTSALSTEALQYGQALTALSVDQLAFRLYAYGRIPVSPRWQGILPDEQAVREHLGIARDGAARPVLDEHWDEVPIGAGNRYWRSWQPRRRQPGPPRSGCKLYVAAHPSALPRAFPAVAESLAGSSGVVAFKVGRDMAGLCRPDSLVAYFERSADLLAATPKLRQQLAGTRVQAVPFTAEVTTDGLLSWGVDPPHRRLAARSSSWRWWVVDRLAEHLVTARSAAAAPLEPWRFALERLSLDGVDTDRWMLSTQAGRGEPAL